MNDQVSHPTRLELLKEYEFCQRTAQKMEETIWQTSAAIGIGLVGTFVVVGLRSIDEKPPWEVAAIIGILSFFLSLIWWFVSRRWWSIQHAMFIRMRHIEGNLGLHSHLYIKYLDDPKSTSDLNLPKNQIDELQDRSNRRGFLGFYDHQRVGVQSIFKWLPVVVLVSWTLYTLWLHN